MKEPHCCAVLTFTFYLKCQDILCLSSFIPWLTEVLLTEVFPVLFLFLFRSLSVLFLFYFCSFSVLFRLLFNYIFSSIFCDATFGQSALTYIIGSQLCCKTANQSQLTIQQQHEMSIAIHQFHMYETFFADIVCHAR